MMAVTASEQIEHDEMQYLNLIRTILEKGTCFWISDINQSRSCITTTWLIWTNHEAALQPRDWYEPITKLHDNQVTDMHQ